MKYVLTDDWDEGVASLSQRLSSLLPEHKVLWLVSGGSNIPAAVKVMQSIAPDTSRNLTISLTDERYGAPGHADSNWAQLYKAGFDGKKSVQLPVLSEGLSFEQTADKFEKTIESAYKSNDIIIAQLGIGADGHTAGILPDSAAANEANSMTANYQSDPYMRLTITFKALRQITAAYVFAFGAEKQAALVSLQSKILSLPEQPAQILKEIPEVILYSDQIGASS